MNKHTMNEPLSYDDTIYTRNLLEDFANNILTFDQLLEVAPSELNLAKLFVIVKNSFITEKRKTITQKIINYYHNRLSEVKNYTDETTFKKLLTVKEVLFLTDSTEIQKMLDGKEIDLAEEIRNALNPVKQINYDFLMKKVFGNHKSKLVIMIEPYNCLFNREKYLKYTPGYMSPEGEISYVTDSMIDEVEKMQAELEIFPARIPTEKYLFNMCKTQAQNQELSK